MLLELATAVIYQPRAGLNNEWCGGADARSASKGSDPRRGRERPPKKKKKKVGESRFGRIQQPRETGSWWRGSRIVEVGGTHEDESPQVGWDSHDGEWGETQSIQSLASSDPLPPNNPAVVCMQSILKKRVVGWDKKHQCNAMSDPAVLCLTKIKLELKIWNHFNMYLVCLRRI